MLNYIEIDHTNHPYVFIPKSHHSIKTFYPHFQVFGGVIHSLAVESVKIYSSLPVNSVATYFVSNTDASQNIICSVFQTAQKKNYSYYTVSFYQNDVLVAYSNVVCSDLLVPQINYDTKSYVPSEYPTHHTWPHDPNKEMILGHLNTHMYFVEKNLYVKANIDGFLTDMAVSATLSDSLAMFLVYSFQAFGVTTDIHTTFFSDVFPQDLHLHYCPIAFSHGSVCAMLNQRFEDGSLLSHTTASAILKTLS